MRCRAIILLLGCSACAEPALPATEGMRLELVFAPGRAERVAAEPISLQELSVAAPRVRGPELHWAFYGPRGRRHAEGRARDTRPVDIERGPGGAASASGTLAVRIPNLPGRLVVSEASGEEIATLSVESIEAAFSASSVPPRGASDIDFETDVLGAPYRIAGPESGGVNILVLPEGYRSGELDDFRVDATAIVSGLLEEPTYAGHKGMLSFWAQDIASAESGISDPDLGLSKDTAFNISFGTEGVPRRCVMPSAQWNGTSVANLRRLRAEVDADVVVILANEGERAGCARYYEGLVVQTVGPGAARVLAHELGHALFQLADEYPGRGDYCQTGPNITTDLSRIPWLHRIAEGTPIPTELGDGDVIGAFAGAGNCSGSVWRPQQTCLMRDSRQPFCEVCREAIGETFASVVADRRFALENRSGGDQWIAPCGVHSCEGFELVAAGATHEFRSAVGAFRVDSPYDSPLPFRWSWERLEAPAQTFALYPSRTPFVAPLPCGPLGDVGGHDAEEEICALARDGIVAGYGDGTYRPDDPIRRGEFASLLASTLAKDAAPAMIRFPDLSQSHFAYEAVRRALGSGFLSGYPDGTFRPDAPIRRQEVLASLAAGLSLPTPDVDALATFPDVADVATWAHDAVAAAVAAGLTGNEALHAEGLRPRDEASRGDTASYLRRAMLLP